MFITETENRQYAVKPMNCPCHVQFLIKALKVIGICHCAWLSLVIAIAVSLQVLCMD